MGALARFERYWFAPVPARRLATLRLLTGAFCVCYLLIHARQLGHFSKLSVTRFDPVGAAFWLPEPIAPALVWSLWGLCVLAGVAFTVGYRFRVFGPAFALLLLWVTSYRNSWGMIFHTENLAVLHVAVLACSRADAALARGPDGACEPADDADFGWPIRLMCALTAATYAIAGLAKLRLLGVAWLEGDVLRRHIAFDAVRKLLMGSTHSPFGLWLARFYWPFPILSAFTLLVELGAPLALLGARLAILWTLAAWAFHVGVLLTMAIAFPYPISGVALASLFPVERIWRWRRLAGVLSWLTTPARGSARRSGQGFDRFRGKSDG